MPLFDETICTFNDNCQKLATDAKTVDGAVEYLRHLEKLWEGYAPYASPSFQRQFLSDSSKYYSLTWEMLLGNALVEHGYNLLPNLSDDAPDLCVQHNGQKIWIECCLPERGDPALPDSVPEPIADGNAHEVHHDRSVLRCTSSLRSKKDQHLRWLKNGVCRVEDAFVIAISGKNLQLSIYEKSLPQILRALYGIGDLFAVFSPDKLSAATGGYHKKEKVRKNNKEEIPTTFFLHEENQHIDGVLFSKDWIMHWSSSPKHCFVENIKAKNKLSPIFEKICQTYEYTENSISFKKSKQSK